MAGTDAVVNHPFSSAKADGPDSTLVRASNWNANHRFTAGADGQKLIRDSSQTDGGSWIDAETCSLTNQTGGAAAVGDVVAISTANDSAVVLDDTQASLKKFVVALATPANAALGPYGKSGPIAGIKAQGAIPRGNYIRKSATTKAIEDTGVAMGSATAPPVGSLGIAMTAAAAGVITAMWFGEVFSTVPVIYTDQLTGLGIVRTSATSITVNIGAAVSDDAVVANRVLMNMTSAILGTFGGTWVVGNSQPKLDTGTIAASTTYHFFVIERLDTGVVDWIMSLSPTTPTLPANYTKQRRIGSRRTNGSAQFDDWIQDGDYVRLVASILDVNSTNPGTSAVTVTLSVPTGVNVWWIGNIELKVTNNNTSILLSDLATTDEAPTALGGSVGLPGFTNWSNSTGTAIFGGASPLVRTNTSAQIRSRLSVSDANTVVGLITQGWIDRRGRG